MRNFRKAFIVIAIFVVHFVAFCAEAANDKIINIGMLAFRGIDKTYEQWQPTADYLSEHIKGYRFRIIPMEYDQLEDAVKNEDLDFVFVNPSLYITYEALYGTTRITTLIRMENGKPVASLGGVIFTKNSRDDINDLKDLKGKRVAAVGLDSLGGYMAPIAEIEKAGISQKGFAKLILTGFPHDKIVYMVQSGESDVGLIRTGILEWMAKEGKIKLSDFKVLAPKKDKSFPFLISTKLYPEWPFAKLKNTPNELSSQVVVALLDIQHNSNAAIKGGYSGWTVPSEYYSVHELMKNFHNRPYDKEEEIGLLDLISRYGYVLLGITAFVLFLVAFQLRLLQLNRGLKKEKAARRESQKKLYEITDLIGEGVYVIDKDGIINMVNPKACELLGYESSELLGFNAHQLFHYKKASGEEYPEDECSIKRAITQKRSFESRVELFFHKDGSPINVSVVSSPVFRDGEVVGSIASFRDNTLFFRQLSALKTLNDIAAISDITPKETLRRALEVGREFLGLPFGIVSHIVDELYQVKVQSSPPKTLADEMEFALGITYCSITLEATDVVAIDDMGNSEYAAHPCFKSFKLSTYIGSPIFVDGNVYGTVNFSAPEIRKNKFDEADIEFVRLLSKWAGAFLERQTYLDELKRLNENLTSKVEEEVAAKLKLLQEREVERTALIQSEKMAQLGNMLGAILHQWKQPLNVIAIVAQDIKACFEYGEPSAEEIAASSDEIMKQVRFMSKTADDFRDFYKPSKEATDFSLKGAVDDILFLLSKELALYSIATELAYSNDVLVHGFESEFKQVVLNIINNAKEALAAKKVASPYICVKIFSEDAAGVLTIADNAGGIPEELLPDKLFESFMTTKEHGTGVGLYLCRAIIEERMNGKISVSNGEDGAIFRIEFPTA